MIPMPWHISTYATRRRNYGEETASLITLQAHIYSERINLCRPQFSRYHFWISHKATMRERWTRNKYHPWRDILDRPRFVVVFMAGLVMLLYTPCIRGYVNGSGQITRRIFHGYLLYMGRNY